MIPLTHCKNKKIFVFGLGLSGESAIRSLEAGGAHVSAWDDNDRVRKNYFGQGKNIINPKYVVEITGREKKAYSTWKKC